MKKLFCCLILLSSCSWLFAQQGPRLFLDIPAIYFTAPDVENISNRIGAGGEAAFYVASHHLMTRIGGGAFVTGDPQAEEFEKTIETVPYLLLEAGGGLFRSNGNKCARTRQSAFTAVAKAGVRYSFLEEKKGENVEEVQKLDFTVGAEFGFFFIRDVFRNSEVFLRGNYFTQAQTASADLGFRLFLNLRANR